MHTCLVVWSVFRMQLLGCRVDSPSWHEGTYVCNGDDALEGVVVCITSMTTCRSLRGAVCGTCLSGAALTAVAHWTQP